MRRETTRAGLGVGFLALAVAILVAWNAPADAYERSIYAATPTAFWAGIGLALSIAIVAALFTRGATQGLGIALGSGAIVAVTSLPVIRNYYFLGMGDSLTHLGWTSQIEAGALGPTELFYPALHSIAAAVSVVSGVPTERAIGLTVVLLFLPFVVFVPLIVRDVTGSAAATGFGAVVAWLVLPINNVSSFIGAHPSTLALFFAPVVLFALVAYLRRRSSIDRLLGGLSPYGIVLAIAGIGMLLVHPQQMLNVLALLVVIGAIQYRARRRGSDRPSTRHRPVYAYTGLLGLAFLAWCVGQPRFRSAIGDFLFGLFSRDIGAQATVGQRAGSLTAIGGSLEEIFAKLFLVMALMGLVAGVYVLLTWRDRTSIDPETRSFLTYFAIALGPLGVIFAGYFLGTWAMAFRQLGFIYVVITIVAAIALAQGTGWLGRRISLDLATGAAAVVLAVCLVLSMATMFASPYIYQPTQHVTEGTYAGYETALEHGGDQPYAGFGFSVERFGDALYGYEQRRTMGLAGDTAGTLDPNAQRNLDFEGAYDAEEYYVTVSQWDVERELVVYEELSYSRDALDRTETTPGVNRVVSTDEFTFYEVTAHARAN